MHSEVATDINRCNHHNSIAGKRLLDALSTFKEIKIEEQRREEEDAESGSSDAPSRAVPR